MEKLDEQQLRTLAELPYGKKYASVRIAAEEELNRRSIATKENLAKFENKYFILKRQNIIKVIKTSKWDPTVDGKYKMMCEYVEFNYDDRPSELERHSFSIFKGKCSWHSNQEDNLKKYYEEITENEWLKWVEKFKKFYSMRTLKDFE